MINTNYSKMSPWDCGKGKAIVQFLFSFLNNLVLHYSTWCCDCKPSNWRSSVSKTYSLYGYVLFVFMKQWFIKGRHWCIVFLPNHKPMFYKKDYIIIFNTVLTNVQMIHSWNHSAQILYHLSIPNERLYFQLFQKWINWEVKMDQLHPFLDYFLGKEH